MNVNLKLVSGAAVMEAQCYYQKISIVFGDLCD